MPIYPIPPTAGRTAAWAPPDAALVARLHAELERLYATADNHEVRAMLKRLHEGEVIQAAAYGDVLAWRLGDGWAFIASPTALPFMEFVADWTRGDVPK